MSDVWQGPGWWLAPDGKWYPADGGPADTVADDAPEPPVDAADAVPTDSAIEAATELDSEPAPDADGDGETESRGGWTAVEPEDSADGPNLADEAQWAAPADDDSVPVAATAAAAATAPSPDIDGAPTRPAAPAPIERDDAWRKPGETASADLAPSTGAPEVVDVAEAGEVEPVAEIYEPPSPWRGVLLALGFLAAIIGLAVIIGLFFINFVLDDDDPDVSTDSSTTTQQSAPTTESTTTTSVDPADGVEVSVFDLNTGDCIKTDIETGELERLVRVDCAVPHMFEVYTEEKLGSSITSFDEDVINTAAEEICRDALDAYIPSDDERDIQFKWFQPTADSWIQTDPEPDRTITCLLFDADGPMTGRAA